MNPRLRLLIIIAIIVAVLAAFNPGMNEFNGYVQKQIKIASVDSPDFGIRDMMSGISKDALNEAKEQGAVRKDYVIFSIFEIRNPREQKVHKVLGFAKKVFIPLNESPKWDEVGKEL
jgi:uncharacterized protein YxeA